VVSHSQEEKYLWEDVESMNADHLKPAKYMKNDKDLIIEELKVRAQPLPTLCVGTCMWGIASQRGDHIWGIMHTIGLHSI
jgi:hypothetical protein